MDILKIIIKNKLTYIGISICSIFVAIALNASIPKTYKSESILLPANVKSSNGLLDLAGVNQSDDLNFKNPAYVVAKAKSRDFFYSLYTKYNLQYYLDNTIAFDSNSQLENAENIDFVLNNFLDYYDIYSESINIFLNPRDNFIYASYTSNSPYFSNYFLGIILKELDHSIALQKRDEATKMINFLKQEINLASSTDVKQSLYNVLESNIEQNILTFVQDNYAFSYIESPSTPLNNPSPNLFTLLLSTFASSLLLLTLILIFLKRRQEGE